MAQTQVKRITANGIVVSGTLRVLRGASLNPAAAAATLIIYDGVDNTGPRIAGLAVGASLGTVVTPELAVSVKTGIYAEITGASADGYVYFE